MHANPVKLIMTSHRFLGPRGFHGPRYTVPKTRITSTPTSTDRVSHGSGYIALLAHCSTNQDQVSEGLSFHLLPNLILVHLPRVSSAKLRKDTWLPNLNIFRGISDGSTCFDCTCAKLKRTLRCLTSTFLRRISDKSTC